eukprot:TRINITY_DN58602_c0_g2_i4.p6 TRINITY_DN58602_c0_g2~~TRINITY_DN58602_c0_g2_i4.p6  ORF type:complete len:116 (-),score=11.68 TRINITY_DN58602_c0_g2_i4:870-1217(-)
MWQGVETDNTDGHNGGGNNDNNEGDHNPWDDNNDSSISIEHLLVLFVVVSIMGHISLSFRRLQNNKVFLSYSSLAFFGLRKNVRMPREHMTGLEWMMTSQKAEATKKVFSTVRQL